MQLISLSKTSQEKRLLNDLRTWQRDSKKYGQVALYDLLSDTINYFKRAQKALDDKVYKPKKALLSPLLMQLSVNISESVQIIVVRNAASNTHRMTTACSAVIILAVVITIFALTLITP